MDVILPWRISHVHRPGQHR